MSTKQACCKYGVCEWLQSNRRPHLFTSLGYTQVIISPSIWGRGLAGTSVGSGRLPKAACDEVAAQPQGLVGPAIDVLHQHVHIGVLAPGGQVQQLIELL